MRRTVPSARGLRHPSGHQLPGRLLLAGLVLASLLLAGCSGTTSPDSGLGEPIGPGESALLTEDAGLPLTTDRSAYQAGDTLRLALSNQTTDEVGYNLCFSALEEEVDGEWVLDTASGDRICLTVLHLLPPGETAEYARQLPADLAPGTWRARASVHLMGEGEHRDVASPPFQVAP